MRATVSHRSPLRTPAVLVVLALLRGVLAVVAIPLAAWLYREHLAVLVLLRPTKEVFLFAGYQLREGNASIPAVVAASLPLLLGGVWVFFGLGRAYGDDLPDNRLLPREKIERLQAVLEEKGDKVVFLGRLAAFPSTLMGAAAGSSGLSWRRFLVADTAGALVSEAALLLAGDLLGNAYESAGIWFTVAGVVVLVAVVIVLGRSLLGGTPTRKARGRLDTSTDAGASKVSPSTARRKGPSSERIDSDVAVRSS
jgi:membrane protein DedA with SNARE-associated domain